MTWIRKQTWGLMGAVLVALVMTAFYYSHPTSHGFRGMLISSSLLAGVLVGMKAGFSSLVWVIYSFVVSFLFGILNIQPFASHDVPPSVVAGLYSLYAAPSGIVGTLLGAALMFARRRRGTHMANHTSDVIVANCSETSK
jgi:hypothetical protein